MKKLCSNCHKRKATENWCANGGILDFVHGIYQRWCKKCCLEAQIKYAEEHKDDLKKLRKERKTL